MAHTPMMRRIGPDWQDLPAKRRRPGFFMGSRMNGAGCVRPGRADKPGAAKGNASFCKGARISMQALHAYRHFTSRRMVVMRNPG